MKFKVVKLIENFILKYGQSLFVKEMSSKSKNDRSKGVRAKGVVLYSILIT